MLSLIRHDMLELWNSGAARVRPSYDSTWHARTLDIDDASDPDGHDVPGAGGTADGTLYRPDGTIEITGEVSLGRVVTIRPARPDGTPDFTAEPIKFVEVLIDGAPVAWATTQMLPPGVRFLRTDISPAGPETLPDPASYADTTFDRGADNVVIGGNLNDHYVDSEGDDRFEGGAGNDVYETGAAGGSNHFDGGSGDDRIDAGDETADLFVDLGTQTGSGGALDFLTFTGVEDVHGGAGDDTLIGDAGDNTFRGGVGADRIEGGAGFDRAEYRDSWEGVFVDLGSQTGSGGTAEGDTFVSIEEIGGSDFDDRIIGDDGRNTILGYDGDDYIDLMGGNDWVAGGSGADTIVGGAGIDRLTYWSSSEGVFIDLEAQRVSGGDAEGDVISGFEEAVGSNNDDVILGREGDDTYLRGGEGDDIIDGRGGDNFSLGDGGADTFVVSSGSGINTIGDFDIAEGDRLDVRGLVGPDGQPITLDDVQLGEDGSGNALLLFSGGERVVLRGVAADEMDEPDELRAAGIPCYAGGTQILTPDGPKPVEAIRVGDRVIDRDRGPVPVLWTGSELLDEEALDARPVARPIRLRAGFWGLQRDMLVSPQHCLLAPGGTRLLRARHLAEVPGMPARVARGIRRVHYHHFLTERHALVKANGAWSESLFPGPKSFRMMGRTNRDRLFRAVPKLRAVAQGADPVAVYGPPARPILARRDVAAHLLREPPMASGAPEPDLLAR